MTRRTRMRQPLRARAGAARKAARKRKPTERERAYLASQLSKRQLQQIFGVGPPVPVKPGLLRTR